MELIKEIWVGAARGSNFAAECGIGDPRQRGDVNHMCCAELSLSVVQCIAKNEAPFGVSVCDLHTLAVQGGDHIARSRGISARHVLDARRNRVNRATGIELRDRRRRFKHCDSAVLVVLHLFHLGWRLQ